jgi:hypothetical protein
MWHKNKNFVSDEPKLYNFSALPQFLRLITVNEEHRLEIHDALIPPLCSDIAQDSGTLVTWSCVVDWRRRRKLLNHWRWKHYVPSKRRNPINHQQSIIPENNPQLYHCGNLKFRLNISVGTAIPYDLNGPRIESRWRRDFPHLSRRPLGPTQPHTKWTPDLVPGGKADEASLYPLKPILRRG